MCKSTNALVEERENVSGKSPSSFEKDVPPTSEMRLLALNKQGGRNKTRTKGDDRQKRTAKDDQPTKPSYKRQRSEKHDDTKRGFIFEYLPDLKSEIAEKLQQLESFISS